MDTRSSDLLKQYIRENDIIQHGNFQLASGKTSNVYCDIKKLSLDMEGLNIASRLLLDEMRNAFEFKGQPFDAVGGLELGCVPLIGALLLSANTAWNIRTLKGFIVRKEPKSYGTQKYIEGPVTPGMRVAIIEDVTTTGKSAHLAYMRAKEFGLIPVIVASIVNRKEGADQIFKDLNIPFVALLDIDAIL